MFLRWQYNPAEKLVNTFSAFPIKLKREKGISSKTSIWFVIWKTDRQRSHRHCRTMYLPVSFALTLRLKTLFSGRPDVIVRTMPSLSIWNLSRKKIERSQRGAESRREKVDYPTNRKNEIKMGSKFQQSPQEKVIWFWSIYKKAYNCIVCFQKYS